MADCEALRAKCRALAGELLTDGDFTALCGAKSVEALGRAMAARPAYRAVFLEWDGLRASRGYLENRAEAARVDRLERLCRFAEGDARRLLEARLRAQENRCVTGAVRACLSGDHAHQPVLPRTLAYRGVIAYGRLRSAGRLDEIEEALGDSPFLPLFRSCRRGENFDLADFENRLDVEYWSGLAALVASLSRGARAEASDYLAARADRANAGRLLRLSDAKRRRGERPRASDVAAYTPYFLPGGRRLTRDVMERALEAETREESAALLAAVCYGQGLGGEHPLTEGFYRASRRRLHAGRVTAPLAYLDLFETENRRLTTVIEGVRLGVPGPMILAELVPAIAHAGKEGIG